MNRKKEQLYLVVSKSFVRLLTVCQNPAWSKPFIRRRACQINPSFVAVSKHNGINNGTQVDLVAVLRATMLQTKVRPTVATASIDTSTVCLASY